MLTISKVTSSLPLSTQTQPLMPPTLQINFPPPSNPFSTSIRSKTVVQRPHTPWINSGILQAKRERSRLERCWRRWKSPFDRMKFRAQCNSVRSLISKAKSLFLSNLVTESSTKSSHTLENPQHSLKWVLQTHFQSPQMHHPLPTHTFLSTCQHISNLNFISKILEKVVASRIQPVFQLIVFFYPICLPDLSFYWNYSSQNSQWPHPSDGSWWGHVTHFSWLICCFWYCRSFHPSQSSSKLVWSWWSFT